MFRFCLTALVTLLFFIYCLCFSIGWEYALFIGAVNTAACWFVGGLFDEGMSK